MPVTQSTNGHQGSIRLAVFALVVGAAVYYAAIKLKNRPPRPPGPPVVAVIRPQDIAAATVPARMDGTHPCIFASLAAGSAPSALGQCALPTELGAVDRAEVDLRYGAFILRQTDLLLHDGVDLPFTRTYTSSDWISNNPQHAFGFNTNHSYDRLPMGTRFPYTYQMLVLEDGDLLYYPRISAGTGFEDAVYMHTETSTRFYKSVLSWNGDGWTLRLADGSEMRFPEAYASKNSAQGAAVELRDAAGDKFILQRDPQRNLQEIRTPHGHWIRFHYDTQSRIVLAENDSGQTVRYAYDNNGMLQSAINSSGVERHYEYQGRLMTAVLDAHNQPLVRNWYASGFLMRQQFANGDAYRYDYTWREGKGFADNVEIVGPDLSERVVTPAESVPDYIRGHP